MNIFFNEAIIFLNNSCNFNCYHCYVKKNQKELSFVDLAYFIDNDIPKFKIQRVSLVGGEPFLYSNLIPLLKKLSSKKDLEIIITTNGSIYNEKFIEPLKSVNLKLLKISLHSLKPEVFSKFTGTKNQYNKVLTNIDKFSRFFNIGINTTVTKLNYAELDRIIHFCRERGIKFLHISQLTTSGKGAGIRDEKLTSDQIKNIEDELKKHSNNNLSISYDNHIFCSFGQKLSINPNSDIYPCPALISYPKYKIGNIYSSSREFINKINKFNAIRTQKCFVEEFIS
ncbi:radical SAM protein [Patescibacteria group bacterium]|nr:radical SAM protein [Patescibacteria group bacterium]MBU2473108.1 radical SAM protein [Patescibacteria group bacterium]